MVGLQASYNGGMASNAYTRTDAVGNSSSACIVKPFGDLAEQGASAHGGLPGAVVHAEVLHVAHVDGDRSVLAAEAYVVSLVIITC